MPNIDLKKTIIFLVIIVFFIAGLFALFNRLNEERNKKIQKRYHLELQPYIKRNRPILDKIFTSNFGCHNDVCDKNAILPLLEQLSSDLSNFSSTAFVKLDKTKSQFLVLPLSGEVYRRPVELTADSRLLVDLLSGRLEKVPAVQYLWLFREAEVFVPFKDGQGVVLGAIARGVIE